MQLHRTRVLKTTKGKKPRQKILLRISNPMFRGSRRDRIVQELAIDAVEHFCTHGDTGPCRQLHRALPSNRDKVAFVRWLLNVSQKTMWIKHRSGTFKKSHNATLEDLRRVSRGNFRNVPWWGFRRSPTEGEAQSGGDTNGRVIFRTRTTLRDGRTAYAQDYGITAFPIRLR